MDYLQYKAKHILLSFHGSICVLNLIINGLPSILHKWKNRTPERTLISFKPYYKWITFNTLVLIITERKKEQSFKPYYKWITFNTNRGMYYHEPLIMKF